MPDQTETDQRDRGTLERKEIFAVYQQMAASHQESSRSLRMWFLAYAVGGPAILVARNEALAIVLGSIWSWLAVGLFFLAIAIQVIGEIFHKRRDRWSVLTAIDFLSNDPNLPDRNKLSISTRYFTKLNTFVADICTFACLALATAIVISILVAHDPAASPVPTTLPVP